MPLVIPDETLRASGMSEAEAKIEIACRLFDADKLSLPAAGKLAELSRIDMEAELIRRQIPIYRPTVKDLQSDVENLKRMGI